MRPFAHLRCRTFLGKLRLAFVFALLSTLVCAEDAATFRNNLTHTGVYASIPVEQFHGIKWKFKTAGRVISSPAVVNGIVYVGSTDSFLHALDTKSGTEKWKFKTGARITSSAAVSAGVVYVESYDGALYAVDSSTGKQLWKFQTAGEKRFAAPHLHGILPETEVMPDPFDFYLSSPAVWNGAVYFGGGDGNVYAIDAASGNLKWKFRTGAVVHASPAIADGVLYIGSWDSYFYALDASSGKEKWRFKTGEDHQTYNQVGIQSSAAVSDGTVYFGCRDSNLYAVDAATGQKKWVFNNKGSWVIGSPAVRDNRIYFATSDSAQFYGVDAKTGRQLFNVNFKWPMFSSPAIAGNMLYLGSNEGKLLVIDLSAEKLAWVFQTDASKQNGPALTKEDGTTNYPALFQENFYDTMVVAVDKLQSVGAILSSPVIVDGVIYFGSTDGNVYAVN